MLQAKGAAPLGSGVVPRHVSPCPSLTNLKKAPQPLPWVAESKTPQTRGKGRSFSTFDAQGRVGIAGAITAVESDVLGPIF